MLDTHSVERQRWEDPSVNHRRPSCSSPVAIGGARPRFCTTLHISPVNARTIVDTSATFILIVSECLHAECLNANADWCRCRQGREKAIMQRRRQQPRVLAWAEAWLFVDTQCASASSHLPRNKVNTSSRLWSPSFSCFCILHSGVSGVRRLLVNMGAPPDVCAGRH